MDDFATCFNQILWHYRAVSWNSIAITTKSVKIPCQDQVHFYFISNYVNPGDTSKLITFIRIIEKKWYSKYQTNQMELFEWHVVQAWLVAQKSIDQ